MTQNPDMQGIYSKLMDYYGTHVQRKDLGDVRRLVHGLGDPNPSIFDIRSFTEEPFDNEWSNVYNTREYDATQPYGFDFGHEHEMHLSSPANDSEDAFKARPDGRVTSNLGQVISTPDGYNAYDGADLALPIVQAAGSYALPMLFGMLMRGGK